MLPFQFSVFKARNSKIRRKNSAHSKYFSFYGHVRSSWARPTITRGFISLFEGNRSTFIILGKRISPKPKRCFFSSKANETSSWWPLSVDFSPGWRYATSTIRGKGSWVHRFQNLPSILTFVLKHDYLLRLVGNLYASVNLQNCYLLFDWVTPMSRWARSHWP